MADQFLRTDLNAAVRRIAQLEDQTDDRGGGNEYLRTDGAECPACGYSGVNVENLRTRMAHAYQDAECPDCGATWVEVYGLTGYCELNPPHGA